MNGLLVLDKPSGMTSHDVVAIVRRATGEKSIGHLGTLDPMATGVLPLLLGKYTRLAQFFGQAEKHYTGHIRFGFATDTFDADGTPADRPPPPHPIPRRPPHPQPALPWRHRPAPAHLLREKDQRRPRPQTSPRRRRRPVKPARITIHNFELTSLSGDTAAFTMSVSAGGYVRSVAHELGQLAGCGAHLSTLRRTRPAPSRSTRPSPSTSSKTSSIADLEALLPHPRTLLPEMPSVTVDDQLAGRLRNGMQVNLPDFSQAPLVKVFTTPTDLLAIGRRIAGTLTQPIVVLG